MFGKRCVKAVRRYPSGIKLVGKGMADRMKECVEKKGGMTRF